MKTEKIEESFAVIIKADLLTLLILDLKPLRL